MYRAILSARRKYLLKYKSYSKEIKYTDFKPVTSESVFYDKILN